METYLRPCEAAKIKFISDMKVKREQGIHTVGFKMEECQPDGWYLPVRETKTEIYCSSPAGNVIADYKFLKTDPRVKGMNCSEYLYFIFS